MENKRLCWDEYFLRMAEVASMRSTCDRARVGAVVVKNNRILGTGYNGAPRGMHHCDDDGHVIYNNHCINIIHAEINAIIQAMVVSEIEGGAIYCTHRPCIECCKMIVNTGIKKVVYKAPYYDDKSESFGFKNQDQYLYINGIEVIDLSTPGDSSNEIKQ